MPEPGSHRRPAGTTGIVDAAIVGGGISGLSAAFELTQRKRTFVVLEAQERAGGIIRTDEVGDFIIDAGPDAMLVQKPAAIQLCNEIGLGDRLVSTTPPRTAFILRAGVLHPLPAASILGFPTRLGPLANSTLFTWRAKARMAVEPFVPRKSQEGDESIADFVRRRFGAEAVSYVAEPLLAGIHAGDVERLSMRSLFPKLVDAETAHGSVIKAFRHNQSTSDRDGAFRSFPRGIGELVDGLLRVLPEQSVRLGTKVAAIERHDEGFAIRVLGGPDVFSRAVILAVPASATAELLRPIDAGLASTCGSIRYLSTATVVFAFPRAAVKHDLQGTGFVVPRSEGLSITAGAWVSSKWPRRAPEGHALLRAFLGGARDPDVLEKNDAQLAQAALGDLAKILHISGGPTLTRVYRWKRSSPQQEVGHGDLIRQIDDRLATHPGLFVSAAGFRGVGIPDCIADARAVAIRAAAFHPAHITRALETT